MSDHVTIGVPVYHGEAYLAETLLCIQNQTHTDFDVLMSVDGPDPVCEEICSEFLRDERFKLVVQPERLGWVGNINWLMSQVTGDFWYFHQQDDLTAENYIEVLLEHAKRNPVASLVYCDLVPFGRIEGSFEQPESVLGSSPFLRLMNFLHDHFPAFALRGLTRAQALAQAGPIPSNEFTSFGCDIAWLTAVGLTGELHHVPMPLYRKRYHANNTESAFWAWPREDRLRIWPVHCVNMLEQVLRLEATAPELRLLWLAAVERLTSPKTAGHFLPVAELTNDERGQLYRTFIERAKASTMQDIPVLLDATWSEIEGWTEGFSWKPSYAPIEIVAFGPNPIRAGQPFNEQPDGVSALWLKTSKRVAPDSRVRLAGTLLKTVLRGTLVTAVVDEGIATNAGDLELSIVGPDGTQRSNSVSLVVEG
jgi:GT2 family glycosyltransferase